MTESSPLVLKAGKTIAVHACVLKEAGGDGCGMGYTYLITDTGWEKLSKIRFWLRNCLDLENHNAIRIPPLRAVHPT